MQQLFKAIYNQFTSTSTGGRKAIYTNVGGRFYLTEAPENAVFPYIVFNLISGTHEWNFKTDYEDISGQFDIFSDVAKPTSINTMYGNLDTCYNNIYLNTSGYACLNMIRQNYFLQKHSLDIPTKPIWHYVIEYGIYLRKL